MRTYLFLTFFWLLAAALVFGYSTTQRFTILDSDWSIGWVLLAFAVFNLLRWWSTRAAAKPKPQVPESTTNPKPQ